MNIESIIQLVIGIGIVVSGLAFLLSQGSKKGLDWKSYRSQGMSVASIVLGLVFLNWLCSNIGWNWWARVWNGNASLFWVTQLAIVYSFCVFLFTKNSYATFFGWLILTVCVLGWFNVKDLGFTPIARAQPEDQSVRSIRLSSSNWTELKVPMGLRLSFLTKESFSYKVNDGPVQWCDSDGHINVEGRLEKLHVLTDRDTVAQVTYNVIRR
jgi:hypothetical protein